MASPQLENGYVRIANELLSAICQTRLNAAQLKILLCLIRYTYGFNRKSHALSISFISRATGTSRRYLSQELNKLIESKIIKVTGHYTAVSSRRLMLNKNYEQWQGYCSIQQQVNNSAGAENSSATGEQFSNTTGAEFSTQEKTNIKTNIKTEQEQFFESLWSLYPEKKGKSKISQKTKAELEKIGFDKLKASIEKYKAYVEGRRKNGFPDLQYQHGSTFFNGGYQDYLGENTDTNGDGYTETRLGCVDITEHNPELAARAKKKREAFKKYWQDGTPCWTDKAVEDDAEQT